MSYSFQAILTLVNILKSFINKDVSLCTVIINIYADLQFSVGNAWEMNLFTFLYVTKWKISVKLLTVCLSWTLQNWIPFYISSLTSNRLQQTTAYATMTYKTNKKNCISHFQSYVSSSNLPPPPKPMAWSRLGSPLGRLGFVKSRLLSLL